MQKEYTIIELLELELHMEENKLKHAFTNGDTAKMKIIQENINYLKAVIIAVENRGKTSATSFEE